MFLLKLISPKTTPKRKTDWKFYHRCYMALLKLLVPSYGKGVINDRIVVNGVEVLHTLRDAWFENELKRFGIGIATALNTVQQNDLRKRLYHRSGIFDWEEKMTVMHSGQDCSVQRHNDVSFSTHIDGKLRASMGQLIFSLVFEERQKTTSTAAASQTNAAATSKQEPDGPKETSVAPTVKRKIHFKDTVDSLPKTQPVEKPQEAPENGTFIKREGFEENDIF